MATESLLCLQNVSAQIDDVVLIDGICMDIHRGDLIALLGPNGAGKTSLLKAALGMMRDASGDIHLSGDNINTLSPRERALRMSYLPQIRPLAWPLLVRDVVAMGRYAYGGVGGRVDEIGERAVAQALSACSIDHLAERSTDTLSGGELARVHLARALSTDAQLLLADEPTAALDPRHQHNIMTLLKARAHSGRGVLVVLHDIQLAAQYADRIVLMDNGVITADGEPADVLTTERLHAVYGIATQIDADLQIKIRPAAISP